MKKLNRTLSILLIVVFIIGIFFLIYYIFFSFPAELKDTLGLRSATDAEKITSMSIKLLLIVGTELAIGLFIFVLLSSFGKNAVKENVVYVEKAKQEKNGEAVAVSENSNYAERAKMIIQYIQQLHRPSREKVKTMLEELCKELEASVGAAFMTVKIEDKRYIDFVGGYAYHLPDSHLLRFEFGEGLAGQVAKSATPISISEVPQGYISVVSGLGKATPKYMIALPILSQDQVMGVIEIASFKPLGEKELAFVNEVIVGIGI
jgi:putative methionine-R-sulfoxide reductase with GAF domain